MTRTTFEGHLSQPNTFPQIMFCHVWACNLHHPHQWPHEPSLQFLGTRIFELRLSLLFLAGTDTGVSRERAMEGGRWGVRLCRENATTAIKSMSALGPPLPAMRQHNTVADEWMYVQPYLLLLFKVWMRGSDSEL